jgi:hypothetical protein
MNQPGLSLQKIGAMLLSTALLLAAILTLRQTAILKTIPVKRASEIVNPPSNH